MAKQAKKKHESEKDILERNKGLKRRTSVLKPKAPEIVEELIATPDETFPVVEVVDNVEDTTRDMSREEVDGLGLTKAQRVARQTKAYKSMAKRKLERFDDANKLMESPEERNRSDNPDLQHLIDDRIKAIAEYKEASNEAIHLKVNQWDVLNNAKYLNELAQLRAGRPLCFSEIARICGVSFDTIVERMKDLGELDLRGFQDNEADIYDFVRLRMVRVLLSLDENEMKKHVLGRSGALWFNSLFNNSRLVRGKSTSNNMNFSLVFYGDRPSTKAIEE